MNDLVSTIETNSPQSGALAQLRNSIDTVVGSVFYGKLLQTMRESPIKGNYGHGGRGEDVFAAQLDSILAERAGEARRYSLNDALYDHLAGQQVRRTPGLEPATGTAGFQPASGTAGFQPASGDAGILPARSTLSETAGWKPAAAEAGKMPALHGVPALSDEESAVAHGDNP